MRASSESLSRQRVGVRKVHTTVWYQADLQNMLGYIWPMYTFGFVYYSVVDLPRRYVIRTSFVDVFVAPVVCFHHCRTGRCVVT